MDPYTRVRGRSFVETRDRLRPVGQMGNIPTKTTIPWVDVLGPIEG